MILEDLIKEVEGFKKNKIFKMEQSEGTNQRKASKLNRVKFADFISEQEKRDYFNSLFNSLILYSYYFYSDNKNDEREKYFNKILKYNNLYFVPYSINWNEDKNNYKIWCMGLNQEQKDVIQVYGFRIKDLNELEIIEGDPFDYLFK